MSKKPSSPVLSTMMRPAGERRKLAMLATVLRGAYMVLPVDMNPEHRAITSAPVGGVVGRGGGGVPGAGAAGGVHVDGFIFGPSRLSARANTRSKLGSSRGS